MKEHKITNIFLNVSIAYSVLNSRSDIPEPSDFTLGEDTLEVDWNYGEGWFTLIFSNDYHFHCYGGWLKSRFLFNGRIMDDWDVLMFAFNFLSEIYSCDLHLKGEVE